MNVVLDEDEKELEKPAAGTITARNSSRSISPSPLASPRAKMESTSMGLSFRKQERISSLLIIPSPLMSIFLNELAASSLPLNCLLILNTTAEAEGHITVMNSCRSISPSPLESPREKMALTSCSFRPAAAISDLLICPSLLLSSFLKADLTSSRVLKPLLILATTVEADGHMTATNSETTISPSL